MTFTEIVDEVMSRLNLSSTEAETRISSAINQKYKEVTSSIGLDVTRRAQVQATVTLGVQELIFTGIEKVLTVIDKSTGQNRMLQEITVDEMRGRTIGTGSVVHEYAILKMDAHAVTILMDTVPQASFTLYADGYERASDLSGSQEPAFPESYHGLLVESVMADELRKMEKLQHANFAREEATKLLSDLRMFIARSAWLDVYQGKTASKTARSGSGSGSGSSSVNGASSYTQTGLITFDRDPLVPFAVTANSAKVTNLDADLLDGEEATDFHDATQLTGIIPDARIPGLTTDGASKIRNITFPAIPVASADVNTLDSYEEGTFTPVLNFGGGSSGITGTRTGHYVKVGQVVTFSLRISLTNKGVSTGLATITGMPFSVHASTPSYAVFPVYFFNLTSNIAGMSAYMASATITLAYTAAGGAAGQVSLTDTIVADTTDLIISGSYRAAS